MGEIWWYEAGPHVFQGIPYHRVICPAESELRQLLLRERAIGLRYSTPLIAPFGRLSYHVTCRDQDYGPNVLSKKARYDVRRGLAFASVQAIPLSRLAEEGWLLRADTLRRQGRTRAETHSWWQRLCRAAEGLPGFEAWGAIHECRLVGALLAFVDDSCCSVLYQQSLTEYLPHGINNALAFHITEEMLRRRGLSQVFYGLHSLDAPASVDEFKFRLGYVAEPVRQRVAFHPWLAPCMNHATHWMLTQMRSHLPERPVIAKAEGLLRFYLQGRQPLDRQAIPDVLMPMVHLSQAPTA